MIYSQYYLDILCILHVISCLFDKAEKGKLYPETFHLSSVTFHCKTDYY